MRRGFLEGDLHDSSLVKYVLTDQGDLLLTFDLWGPEKKTATVRFVGVKNVEEVRAFLEQLEPLSDGYLSGDCLFASPKRAVEGGAWIVEGDLMPWRNLHIVCKDVVVLE